MGTYKIYFWIFYFIYSSLYLYFFKPYYFKKKFGYKETDETSVKAQLRKHLEEHYPEEMPSFNKLSKRLKLFTSRFNYNYYLIKTFYKKYPEDIVFKKLLSYQDKLAFYGAAPIIIPFSLILFGYIVYVFFF